MISLFDIIFLLIFITKCTCAPSVTFTIYEIRSGGRTQYHVGGQTFNTQEEAMNYLKNQNPGLRFYDPVPQNTGNNLGNYGTNNYPNNNQGNYPSYGSNRFPYPQTSYNNYPQANGIQSGDRVDASNYYKDQSCDTRTKLTSEEKEKLRKVPRYTDYRNLVPYPLTSDLLMAYYYDRHDIYRRCHNVLPLKVDKGLIDYAQAYANHLSSIDKMQHDPTLSTKGQGENLAVSTIPVGYAGVEMWYDEYKMYDFRSGKYSPGVGHFTQMVWGGSRIIGCGSAISRTNKLYVVCRYHPQGNILTLFTQHVHPASYNCQQYG
uniref:SCP domain-containing protein n=1 Tax=Parastrongyloides trichosuri TaxID=131310 RepID=A0A0N5A0Q6_PARTI